MKQSLTLMLDDMLGFSSTNKREIEILRTQIWLKALLHRFHINRYQLQENVYDSTGKNSGIVWKWWNEDYPANLKSVEFVAEKYKKSDEIFKLPLFELLTDKKLTLKQLKTIIDPYLLSENFPMWNFPSTGPNCNNEPFLLNTHEGDSDTLFQRGDIYGFIGILYLVRKAEIKNDVDTHAIHLRYAYKAFPALCRYHHFKHARDELLTALVRIHRRMRSSLYTIAPDFNTLERQILAKELITLRVRRPRHPINRAFIELKAPYKEATY